MFLNSCRIHWQQNHNMTPWWHQPHSLVLGHILFVQCVFLYKPEMLLDFVVTCLQSAFHEWNQIRHILVLNCLTSRVSVWLIHTWNLIILRTGTLNILLLSVKFIIKLIIYVKGDQRIVIFMVWTYGVTRLCGELSKQWAIKTAYFVSWRGTLTEYDVYEMLLMQLQDHEVVGSNLSSTNITWPRYIKI